MSSLANIADLFFGGFVSALIWPCSAFDPLWGLLLVSAVSGVVLLKIYGLVSNQKAIRKVKSDIGGALLEVVLYRHDVRTILGAQFSLFKLASKYFLLAVPPIVVLMIPCILLLAQLNLRFGYRPVSAGEPLIVSAVAANDEALQNLKFVPQAGVSVTPPVRIPATREAFWRLTPAEGEGPWHMRVEQQSKGFDFVLNPGSGMTESFWSVKWWNWLLYPGSDRINGEGAALKELAISYPASSYRILGMEMNWIVVFFLVSLLSGLVASRYMGVEI